LSNYPGRRLSDKGISLILAKTRYRLQVTDGVVNYTVFQKKVHPYDVHDNYVE